jgi:hypothetical protein
MPRFSFGKSCPDAAVAELASSAASSRIGLVGVPKSSSSVMGCAEEDMLRGDKARLIPVDVV